jgi:hypothetical protein
VKKGKGEKYIPLFKQFVGKKIKVDSVNFSTRNGRKIEIELLGKGSIQN